MREERKIEAGETREEHKITGTNIAGPVSVWLLLLFVGLAIQFFVTNPVLVGGGTNQLASWLSSASGFILYTPGDIILPLVIGAAIGAEVGLKANSMKKAQKSGLFNGVYASLVYTIAIVVIYEILAGVLPNLAPSLGFMLTSWVALPIIICMVLTEIFAVLSYSRKVNA